jgi:Holliday junction resolvase RusA-like endonuclease
LSSRTPYTVAFTHLGEPYSKSNALKRGRGTHLYKDPKYVKYENALADTAREAMGDMAPFEGPVSVYITCYFKSYVRKDLTNMPKTLCDALNNVVYEDDYLIVDAHLNKLYDPENPRVEIFVEELPDDPAYPLTRCKPRKRSAVRKSLRKATVGPADGRAPPW